jgi:hypothetical protein
MTRRIHIERLELDLRGLDPKAAESAARTLGPSLQMELARRRGRFESAPRIEAGGIAPSTQPREIAARLAHRVALRTRGR